MILSTQLIYNLNVKKSIMKKDVVVGIGEIGKPVTDKFVNNDLDLFNYIIPCGLPGSRTTSMQKETSQIISIQQVRCRFEEILQNYFNCEVRIV